jgi:hypothetical protein
LFWYVLVIVEACLCGWVQLERRRVRQRGAGGGALPPLHRLYGRVLGRLSEAAQERGFDSELERREARRRTGLVTFWLVAAGMVPPFLFIVVDGFHMSPAVGQLITWPVLWLAPMLTFAPARLLALLVAVWRGWVRLDDGDGGQWAAVPVPGSGPGSHDYRLPR